MNVNKRNVANSKHAEQRTALYDVASVSAYDPDAHCGLVAEQEPPATK
jgi:hypothetical protein